jgi:WASH complex subunit 7
MRVIISARVFSQQQIDMLNSYVLRLETITQIGATLSRICDNSWLYWHRNFVPMYLRELYNSPTEAHRLPYLFASLRDCTIPLLTVKHEPSPDAALTTFQNEIRGYVDDEIVRPLCRDIENDLRLHIHTGVVRLDDRNPFKVGLQDLTHLLRVGPLNFLAVTIDIKALVTHYLDSTFYNLNTVALHDWKVYGQMRNLAEQKYVGRWTPPRAPPSRVVYASLLQSAFVGSFMVGRLLPPPSSPCGSVRFHGNARSVICTR